VVVVDYENNAVRYVTKDGAVSTMAGFQGETDLEAGLDDGQGPNARFWNPEGVVVAANGDFFVADRSNHAIRVLTPEGDVRTLCGNGESGFADGQGPAQSRAMVKEGLLTGRARLHASIGPLASLSTGKAP
jgi:hypothetical protein